MDIENNATVAFSCLKSMPRSPSGTSIVTTSTLIPHLCMEAVERKATHTSSSNLGIRMGVVKVDVPERELGIDFKHRNATS